MVYTPTGEGVGVSRRLEDKGSVSVCGGRPRGSDLRGGGAIVRTAGARRDARGLRARAALPVQAAREVLEKRVETTRAPALVFQGVGSSRSASCATSLSEHFERAVVDDPDQHHRLVSFFTCTAPELVSRVELYEGEVPLFDAYKVNPVIDFAARAPRRPRQRSNT